MWKPQSEAKSIQIGLPGLPTLAQVIIPRFVSLCSVSGSCCKRGACLGSSVPLSLPLSCSHSPFQKQTLEKTPYIKDIFRSSWIEENIFCQWSEWKVKYNNFPDLSKWFPIFHVSGHFSGYKLSVLNKTKPVLDIYGEASWISTYYYFGVIVCFFPRSHYKIFFYYVSLFLRAERDRAWVGEGQRERDTQNLKQAPGPEPLDMGL